MIVVTGASGMLGAKLARALLDRDRDSRLILTDLHAAGAPDDSRARFIAGDIGDRDFVRAAIGPGTRAIVHLAGVVSAGAERDFELGYRANLDGTRHVLEAARALGTGARVVFASSIAAYGGALPDTVDDDQRLTPETSYGTQKAIGELLVADHARKGFIDGRSLRLPTVVVRPGKPNLAASTFASSIVREPLLGERAICPVTPDTMMPLLSPRMTIRALLRALDLPSDGWPRDRAITLPSLDVTVGDIVAALRRVGGEAAYRRIEWKPDPAIQRIVAGWPRRLDSGRARALGFEADESIDAIIQAFIEDDLPAMTRAAQPA